MADDTNQIRDGWARIIGIPSFGIGIPNLTGLFGELGPSDLMYWGGYVYFVTLAAAIWHGNRWLLFKEREHLDWFDRPIHKILVLVFGIAFFTAPLTVGWLWGWYRWAGFSAVNWPVIQTVTLANVICVFFVAHVYETTFLVKARETDMLRVARLERARAEAELAALHHQIDPHFLFNALNTLSHLIDTDPETASRFNASLARVYRYVLQNRDRRLVLLSEELAFVSSYVHLMELRFPGAIRFEEPGASGTDRWLIPPTALQVLVENAVKHNEISDTHPMKIHLQMNGDAVTVRNDRRAKPHGRPSAELGLANLNERCRLLVERGIEVEDASEWFKVTIPLLRAAS